MNNKVIRVISIIFTTHQGPVWSAEKYSFILERKNEVVRPFPFESEGLLARNGSRYHMPNNAVCRHESPLRHTSGRLGRDRRGNASSQAGHWAENFELQKRLKGESKESPQSAQGIGTGLQSSSQAIQASIVSQLTLNEGQHLDS